MRTLGISPLSLALPNIYIEQDYQLKLTRYILMTCNELYRGKIYFENTNININNVKNKKEI